LGVEPDPQIYFHFLPLTLTKCPDVSMKWN